VASSCHKRKKETLSQTFQKGQKRGLEGVTVKNEIKEEKISLHCSSRASCDADLCTSVCQRDAHRDYSKLLNRDFISSSVTLFSCCSISAIVSSSSCRANSYAEPIGKTLLLTSICAGSALPPAKDLRGVGLTGAWAGNRTTVSAKGNGAVRCAVNATTLAPAPMSPHLSLQ
jgi:hypothetical protein